jgi:predicted CoA-binding protein
MPSAVAASCMPFQAFALKPLSSIPPVSLTWQALKATTGDGLGATDGTGVGSGLGLGATVGATEGATLGATLGAGVALLEHATTSNAVDASATMNFEMRNVVSSVLLRPAVARRPPGGPVADGRSTVLASRGPPRRSSGGVATRGGMSLLPPPSMHTVGDRCNAVVQVSPRRGTAVLSAATSGPGGNGTMGRGRAAESGGRVGGASDGGGAVTAEERQRAREMLDLQEDRGGVPLLDDDAIAALLRASIRIAIVGASPRPGRPSRSVLEALLRRGWDAVPVTPAADEVAGMRAYPTLDAAVEATGRFDIVDVFRRPGEAPGHAQEAVAAGARCLWLQIGVVSWEAARIAHDGGLLVVMDRCTLIEDVRVFGQAGRPRA